MNEINLFSGIGGGLLASLLSGFTTIAAVEIDAYCQKILKQRQADGYLPKFPIYSDVKKFDAAQYKGKVDIVTGGFPCQPFSSAGRHKGKDDARNLFPDTMRIINECESEWLFLENVRGLLSIKDQSNEYYFNHIIKTIAESGYDVTWAIIGASDLGAPHHRKRLWICGHRQNANQLLPNASSNRASVSYQDKAFDSLKLHQGWTSILSKRPVTLNGKLYPAYPTDLPMADELPDWMDEFKAIGNGQVSIVAWYAWTVLSRRLIEAQQALDTAELAA